MATTTPAAASAATSTPATATTPAAAAPSSGFNSTSLYVGDLANDVNETNLFDLFNPVGPVASIRVCRDAITRRSLGYAYVNFHSAADADKALDILNNQPIKGKPCRIMWSQRDPSVRKSGKGNIFIKNLDKSIDHKSLFDTFSQFGSIVSCKIELDDGNSSKGYGYIQFATQEEADNSCAKVNGKMMAGKKVFVGPFLSRKDRNMNNGSMKYTNIYVNNLSETVDDEKLKKMFEQYGVIKSAVIMKDDAGKSKGFAFINYDAPEDAQKAVEEKNGKEIDGKTVFVGRAQKKAERESELRQKFEVMKMEHMAKYQGVNLYVKNLDDDFDDAKFIQVFSAFGTITSARVMFDADKRSKGFGFVCYSNPEEATKAVTEMNGKIVGTKPLYVALAQRKDVRKMQLEAQFAQRTKGVPPRMPGAMPPLYNGAPMFYAPQGGAPGQAPFFVGGPNMVPRRFAGAPGPYQPIPPNSYMVVNPQGGRGQAPMKNMRGGAAPRSGRGMKHPQNNQHANQHNAAANQPAMQPIIEPVAMGGQAPMSTEEQKRLLGEKLYPLILKTQPQLAGKITGMILESSFVEDILSLLESNDLLNEKIEEAVKVLKEYNEKQ